MGIGAVQGKQKQFTKILIANRGEIASRIIRTACRLGYQTVAICSEIDRNALYVRQADRAIAIGGCTPSESYLSVEKVVGAAIKSGADAVHPGYGFLSENAEFAEECWRAGITFIGPGAEAIRIMGDKSRAKELMTRAGVSCIPGYQGGEQDLDRLAEKAKELGWPLMIKAAAGGGGRGLRLVCNPCDLLASLQAARTEAERAFGSGQLLLERALTRARHIEVQVFGDLWGNVIHLGERDCSIQRRHQKIFEESPSPAVDEALREEMGQAACRAARAVDYTGAGTVEFLLDGDGRYYFLEMNTRLQVEHPVTEMVTGYDLVEWQINIASGYPLPVSQQEVRFSGHAIEARLYAEDPREEFRPQAGRILCWRPVCDELARTDHGLKPVDEVSPYYDAMLAKVIVQGQDRQSALRKLARALGDTVILGIKTNREYLLDCLAQDKFQAGTFDTGFVDSLGSGNANPCPQPEPEVMAVAAILFVRLEMTDYGELTGWSNSPAFHPDMKLSVNGASPLDVSIDCLGPTDFRFLSNGAESRLQVLKIDERSAVLQIDGIQQRIWYALSGRDLHVSMAGRSHVVTDATFNLPSPAETADGGEVSSPASGLVESVMVVAGQDVKKGAPLFTLDSMKLLQTVYAPVSGRVLSVLAGSGQQVRAKELVVEIDPGPMDSSPPKSSVAAVVPA